MSVVIHHYPSFSTWYFFLYLCCKMDPKVIEQIIVVTLTSATDIVS